MHHTHIRVHTYTHMCMYTPHPGIYTCKHTHHTHMHTDTHVPYVHTYTTATVTNDMRVSTPSRYLLCRKTKRSQVNLAILTR